MQRISLLLVAVLVLAGCTSDDSSTQTTAPTPTATTTPRTTVTAPEPSTTVADTTTTVAATTTTDGADVGTDIGPQESDPYPGSGDTAYLTSVEVTEDATIVFEFEDDAVPAYRVEYVEPPIIADPSGLELDLDGDAFLNVVVNPGAGVDLSGNEPRETFEGDDRFTVESVEGVEELAEIGDFENVLSWTIGLSARHPFSVESTPGSLVVSLATPADTSASLLGTRPKTCSDADGFSLAYPADWWAGSGATACQFFSPEPMSIEPDTDMTAPVTARVAEVDFRTAVDPSDARREISRAASTVDGRSAVRITSTVEEGLYPTGTELTTYFVRLARDDGSDRTLILTTAELGDYDYRRNVALLDEMARTLELDQPGPADLIATYRGGGEPFEVHADTSGSETCLTVVPAGERTCLTHPEGNRVVASIAGEALVGLAGPEVHLVGVQDGPAFLPVPTVSGGSAWAVPFDGSAFEVLGSDGETVLIGQGS